MVERNHRRIGLGVSLIAIGIVLAGLWLYIKKIESWSPPCQVGSGSMSGT